MIRDVSSFCVFVWHIHIIMRCGVFNKKKKSKEEEKKYGDELSHL